MREYMSGAIISSHPKQNSRQSLSGAGIGKGIMTPQEHDYVLEMQAVPGVRERVAEAAAEKGKPAANMPIEQDQAVLTG